MGPGTVLGACLLLLVASGERPAVQLGASVLGPCVAWEDDGPQGGLAGGGAGRRAGGAHWQGCPGILACKSPPLHIAGTAVLGVAGRDLMAAAAVPAPMPAAGVCVENPSAPIDDPPAFPTQYLGGCKKCSPDKSRCVECWRYFGLAINGTCVEVSGAAPACMCLLAATLSARIQPGGGAGTQLLPLPAQPAPHCHCRHHLPAVLQCPRNGPEEYQCLNCLGDQPSHCLECIENTEEAVVPGLFASKDGQCLKVHRRKGLSQSKEHPATRARSGRRPGAALLTPQPGLP